MPGPRRSHAWPERPGESWGAGGLPGPIISVHVPKTAGRSFLTFLETRPLLEYAATEGLRNLQTRYLDVPLERFTLVGRTERFFEDLGRVSQLLGLAHEPVPIENTNANRHRTGYELPVEVRNRIAALNDEDARLYRRVCEHFHGERA